MKQHYLVILALLVLFTTAFPSSGTSAPEDYYRMDVLVLMDGSGSTQTTDPNGMRFKAFEELLLQLEKGDRVGLFQFGSNSELIFPLTEIIDDTNRTQLIQQNIPQESLGFTNVKDVLIDAYQEMIDNYNAEHLPFFILFTDGEIIPNSSYENDEVFKEQYLAELTDVIAQFRAREWPIYIINLNSMDGIADPKLVEISEITGGQMMDINAPEVLIETFQKVLG